MQTPFYSSIIASLRPASVLRVLLLSCLLVIGTLLSAQASHFRYGDMSWRVVQSNPTGRTIEFKVSAGWALSFTSPITINFGDGTSGTVPIGYTNINGVYQYGTGTLQHTYGTNGNFTAVYSGGNKISNLQNNANGSWYVSSVVNVGAGNSSPVSTVPAVVNMPIGLANARFIVPAADPDGRALSFRLATGNDWYGVQPSGLSINSATGEITFNTVGKSAGLLYNAGIIISNGRTEVLVDFIIQTVQQSNPPQFDYAVTPANQRVFNVSPGQLVSFNVKATCVDAGSTVRLSAVGMPAGAAVSPAFGVYANPVQHSFSWTPTASQFGTFVVNFTAESNVGAQTATSVSIIVSQKPRFDVPPTPAEGVDQVYAPGQPISQAIQASNVDPTNLVRIISAQEKTAGGALVALPAGAGFLPTAAANPTSGTFDWTPAGSSWGEHTMVFTAAESHNEQATHEVSYLVNTVPVFTSAPNTRADVGQPYTYNVTVSDPDLAYGDAVNFSPTLPLPAWLTLTTDPATGTAVLSGTPPASAAGTLTVYLQAEDIHHHAYPTTPEQVFTITINNCTVQAVAQNVTVLLDASGAASVTAAQVNNGSTASCGIASVQVSPSAFTCANTGANAVTLTVTDVNGNVNTATATVTVADNLLPTIAAPANVSVSTDAGQCSATGVALGNSVATDNCGATVTNDAPATFAKGTTTVTWTATDAAGNVATATQTVTVIDTEKPVLIVPANIIASAPATQCGAVVSFAPTATDNCAATVVASPASGSTFAVGTTTVTVTATDAAGNTSTGSFTVTVNDVTAPAVATRNVTVTLVNGAASVTAADVNNSSTDACGIASYSLNRSIFSCATLGSNPVVLTVTDIHGNVASASATVTVVGSIPAPTILVTPTSNVYTGGVPTNLYLGYGSQSATLTATGGVSYAWSPAKGLSNTTVANPVFTATTAGTFTYTVTATNVYGCTATKTVTLRVVDARCDKDKVVVCHNGHEICISPNAVPAHLGGHAGDQLGACGTASRQAAPAATAELATELVFEAYPNPFGASTTVHFRPLVSAPAQVRVFDTMGRVVSILFSGATEAGHDYSLTLDGMPLAAGIYLCRYESQGQVHTQRLSVVK